MLEFFPQDERGNRALDAYAAHCGVDLGSNEERRLFFHTRVMGTKADKKAFDDFLYTLTPWHFEEWPISAPTRAKLAPIQLALLLGGIPIGFVFDPWIGVTVTIFGALCYVCDFLDDRLLGAKGR